jgi:hypothetical protein
MDTTYTDGLRAGFANLQPLPNVVQANIGIERTFQIAGVGQVSDRLILLNVFNRST